MKKKQMKFQCCDESHEKYKVLKRRERSCAAIEYKDYRYRGCYKTVKIDQSNLYQIIFN